MAISSWARPEPVKRWLSTDGALRETFGRVYKGVDVAHKIGSVKTDGSGKSLEPVYIHRVIIHEMKAEKAGDDSE